MLNLKCIRLYGYMCLSSHWHTGEIVIIYVHVPSPLNVSVTVNVATTTCQYHFSLDKGCLWVIDRDN